jgi:hypothetical protein
MAAVQWSALVSQMKGKLRGDVLQGTQSGQVVRSNGRGKPFGTPYANSVRNIAGFVASSWALIPTVDIAAWQAATSAYPTTDRFGNSRTPSAYNLYCRLNMALVNASQGMLTYPAAPAALTNISGVFVDYNTAGRIAFTSPNAATASEIFLCNCSRPFSPGKRKPSNGYRNIFHWTPGAYGSVELTSEIATAWGTNQVGSQYQMKFQVLNVNTGQLGVPFYLSWIQA